MATIDINDLTTAKTSTEGTGIFDQLMQAVETHINEQYASGRIKGTEYANVYLGAIQAVLSQSITFLMQQQEADLKAELLREQIESENKNNEPGGVIDLQKQKLQEELDLVVAQTAKVYEDASASQKRTIREDTLNSVTVDKVKKEATLISAQNAELLLNGPIERNLKTAETSAITTKTNAEVSLLDAKTDEERAATIRKDAESSEKVLLIEAQTTGFKTDIKQKILKQMLDGYAVNLSVSNNAGVLPKTTLGANIDLIANDILDDVNSTVNIA